MNQPIPSPEDAPEARVSMTSDLRERSIQLARGLWMAMEFDTVPTHLEDADDETCVLCFQHIPEGPAWLIVDLQERSYGYTGNCCYELATKHGVTRAETEHGVYPGMPLVPAHLAPMFPPNVMRLPLPRRA